MGWTVQSASGKSLSRRSGSTSATWRSASTGMRSRKRPRTFRSGGCDSPCTGSTSSGLGVSALLCTSVYIICRFEPSPPRNCVVLTNEGRKNLTRLATEYHTLVLVIQVPCRKACKSATLRLTVFLVPCVCGTISSPSLPKAKFCNQLLVHHAINQSKPTLLILTLHAFFFSC